ncbi:hypothetical protein EDO6_02100 [Paenibacillus xylanexedens]|nr:hypothetical protein EDO6_02100 [Paenibacillus xylanexedens]
MSLSFHRGFVIVIIALLFVFLSLFPDPMSSKWVSLALCLIYMVSFWYVYQLSSTRMLSVLFALLYVVSLYFGLRLMKTRDYCYPFKAFS